MKKNPPFRRAGRLLFPLLLSLLSLPGCASLGRAQTGETVPPAGIPRKTEAASEFPPWIRDLRRAEVVAFGSFPFTMFAATFSMDTYRWISHGGGVSEEARKYAPWPFKGSGAVDMSNDEHKITLAAAAAASVTIALLDYIVIQTKRHKARERAEKMPPGTPIITRTPAVSGPEGAFGPDDGFPGGGDTGGEAAPPAEEDGVPGQAPGSP